MKQIFLLIALILLNNGFAEEDMNANNLMVVEVGGGIGWNAPYGTGVELAFYPTPNVNINAGGGISFAGFKYGLGTKYFFKADQKFSPYVGASYYHAGGLSQLTVKVNNDSALYKVTAGHSLGLRAGLRVALSKVNFYGTVGYGLPLSGGKSIYREGVESEDLETAAELFEPQGLELSFGMSFRIKGNEPIE
ncbi:MAG: hypothetical protein OCC49_17285 [Fibrobacterales bacterium]